MLVSAEMRLGPCRPLPNQNSLSDLSFNQLVVLVYVWLDGGGDVGNDAVALQLDLLSGSDSPPAVSA